MAVEQRRHNPMRPCARRKPQRVAHVQLHRDARCSVCEVPPAQSRAATQSTAHSGDFHGQRSCVKISVATGYKTDLRRAINRRTGRGAHHHAVAAAQRGSDGHFVWHGALAVDCGECCG
jgi:hypothetical protein